MGNCFQGMVMSMSAKDRDFNFGHGEICNSVDIKVSQPMDDISPFLSSRPLSSKTRVSETSQNSPPLVNCAKSKAQPYQSANLTPNVGISISHPSDTQTVTATKISGKSVKQFKPKHYVALFDYNARTEEETFLSRRDEVLLLANK